MEPLGILFTWILVFMLRGHRSAFRLALLAAVMHHDRAWS